MTHSPGPWRVVENLSGCTIKAVDHGKWYTIARVGSPALTQAGDVANATLMAASCDLLDALDSIILEADSGWLRESPVAHKALAAMRKAREGT